MARKGKMTAQMETQRYVGWMDEDPGSCPECGKAWELVRPGKSQPTCDCQDYCHEHPDTKCEHTYPPKGHTGGGIWGWLCPKCHPDSFIK